MRVAIQLLWVFILGFTLSTAFAQTVFALAFTDCASQFSIPQTQCQALVDLYDNTNGAGWTGTTGWKLETDPCIWSRVTCSVGNVIQLNIANSNLMGPFLLQ